LDDALTTDDAALLDLSAAAAVAAMRGGVLAAESYARSLQASTVDVRVDADDANFHLSIEDDGIGGADVGKGSGLTGLVDRVEALGGTMDISSRTGCGTSLRVTIPLQAP